MKYALAAFLLLTSTVSVFAQNTITLMNVRRVYIEKMEDNLDQYLISEISRKFHGNMIVVLDRSQADAVLRGINLGTQNTSKGTVQLVDPSGKAVLWSGSAGDRSAAFLNLKHGGEQKVASHLIDQLHKAMQR